MNILDLLHSKAVKPRRVAATRGGEWHSACPVCGGKDRFQSWPNDGREGGRWYCRQCDTGGDCIQFLRHVEGLGFREACQRLGLERALDFRRLPEKHRQAAAEAFAGVERELPPAQWRERAGKLVLAARAALGNNPEQSAWLAGRGIWELEAERYHLGWLEGENGRGSYFRARSAWGLADTVATAADGRQVKKTKLWIPRGLVIPTIRNGEVAALRIRLTEADRERLKFQDKYYAVPGSTGLPLVARNGDHRGPARVWVIVESQLDAIICAEHWSGPQPLAAASMISNTGKPDPALHRHLGAADLILCAHDADEAGHKGWLWWKKTYPNAVRWPVPEGKDPGEYFARGGNIHQWLAGALSEYLKN